MLSRTGEVHYVGTADVPQRKIFGDAHDSYGIDGHALKVVEFWSLVLRLNILSNGSLEDALWRSLDFVSLDKSQARDRAKRCENPVGSLPLKSQSVNCCILSVVFQVLSSIISIGCPYPLIVIDFSP